MATQSDPNPQFSVRAVGAQFCVFSPDGEKQDCFATEEEAQAAAEAKNTPVAAFEGDVDEEGPSRTYLNALLGGLREAIAIPDEVFSAAMRKARAYAGGSHRSRKAKNVPAAPLEAFGETADVSRLCSSDTERKARGEWALFMPFQMAEEQQSYQWIPYLPVPGQYESPKYGTIALTPDRSKNFVANFKAAVYQKHLPIDAEHDLKTSGALGHIEDMRHNTDGSVDALVKWNDRGQKAVDGDRFRYFSPEWYDQWRDPMTLQVHKDVAIGGALTTRPFFKEKALRPLVAASEALDVWTRDEKPIRFERKENKQMTEKKGLIAKLASLLGPDVKEEDLIAEVRANTATEEPKRETALDLRQATERMNAAEKRLQAAEERAEVAETRLSEASNRLNALEREGQRKRFFDIVMGRTAQSKVRWFGEEQANVDKLVMLAEKLGEDSKEFQEIVRERIAHANQIHSVMATEVGTRTGFAEGGVMERVDEAAKQLREANPNMTIEKARQEVWKTHPEWKREYRETQSRR